MTHARLARKCAIVTSILLSLSIGVCAQPLIEVSPGSMSFDVPPDGIGSAGLTIVNTGDAPLHYTISPEPVAGSMNVPSAVTATEVHAVDWTSDHVPGRLIVGLKPGVTAAAISSLHQQFGAKVIGSYKLIPAQVVEVPKDSDLRKVREAYAKSPQVAYAEPDYILTMCAMPNDPNIPGWMSAISAYEAWDVTTGSDSITVAVLDSGLDVTHPDLAANVWTNPGEIAGNGFDDDHNGYVDDIHGWNFWNNNADLTDNFGHGTHCAGIVGAVGNNGIGVVGVNWKVKLLMTKWGDDHEGPTSMMISCLEYAMKMGARVSSNSYGASAYSQAAYDAIAAAGQAGHLFVAAAGNDGRNNDVSPTYPCSYNLDNIISVAAFNFYTQLSSFSNYGLISVDLAAPGEGIISTFPGNTYKVWQGTSMACPHVAGAAALVLAHSPELSPIQVKSRILSGVDQYSWFAGKLSSGGSLNVYRSLGVPWLDATPATGEIAPGESVVVRVGVNAKSLPMGFTETCTLEIESDDPNQPLVSVPVTLSVNTYVWFSYSTPLPDTEDTTGPYSVDPYVSTTGIDESSLAVFWNTTGSGAFNEAPMIRTDPISGLCHGEIPGQPAGTTVYYYIYARDTAGHVGTHPVSAPTNLHRFTVLLDATPPVIEHTPLGDTDSLLGPYTVNAIVTDDLAVGAVVLHWRKNAGPFTQVGMTASGGRYSANVPGPASAGDRFTYYISARDTSAAGNVSTHPATAPADLNSFRILRSGVVTLTDPNGGEWYEPGNIVPVRWVSAGTDWTAGETVMLEYSGDGGSTWSAISGAENLPYDAGSFDWDTAGIAESDRCRVRVARNGDPLASDVSNADFTIQADTTAPTIAHMPLTDSPNLAGPYRITAAVRDNFGIRAVTLYWSRNGGEIVPVAMTPSGNGFDYIAEIAGPSQRGDRYCYYIEAVDISAAGNTTRDPVAGSGAPHCFTINSCGVEEIGDRTRPETAGPRSRGNVFACTVDSALTGIEQYLGIDSSTELRFFVYESASIDGTYALIHETTITSSGVGLAWYGSGPIQVELHAQRYYIIGASWQKSCHYFYGGAHPASVAFGRSIGGFELSTNRPPATTENPNLDTLFNQRLSMCNVDRMLRIVRPNGGEVFEPGNSIRVEVSSHGRQWLPGDTARLECASDGGSTWSPITGAESLPHDMASFDWDTTGVVESEQYKVRAVFNDDPAVSDMSDADFTIRTDTTAPMIVHTALPDTGSLEPYRVAATVTDELGLASITLHWRRNRGDFSSIEMTPSGGPNEYCADIPGSGRPGDRYCYYIEASDVSYAANTARHPSDAPGSLNCFTILPCAQDELGGTTSNAAGSRYVRGNVFQCTSTTALTEIEQYMNITAPTELRFAVYEADSEFTGYTKISETVIPSSGTGVGWYSSGPISVPFVAGRYYIVAAGGLGLTTFYWSSAGHPTTLNFGRSLSGYASNIYPPRAVASNPSQGSVYRQRLSTCAPSQCIGEVKCLADDSSAVLADDIVTAVFADRFYVQEPDRSCGIGVLWSEAMPSVGDRVNTAGALYTLDAERLVDGASVLIRSSGERPVPIGMTNFRLGGNDRAYSPGPPPIGQKGFVGAIGLNNIGLLVRVWGCVTRIGDGYFYIDDGSALRDGTFTGEEANIGVRVICDPAGRSVGDYLAVTGIISCFRNESGDIARRMLAHGSDVVKLN